MFYDNSAAIFIAKNNKSGSQSKHIDIKYLAITEHVKEKKVIIDHVTTELMLTDPLPEGLPPLRFQDLVGRMGLGILLCNCLLFEQYLLMKLLFMIFLIFVHALILFEKISLKLCWKMV